MKQINYKKLILPNIPYLFIGLFATKLGQAARLSPGVDFSSKVLNMMDGISMAFENILPSFHPVDLLVGTAAAVIIRLVVYFKGKNAKKFRKNLEYGSARWGNREDIAPFVDPVFENNIILTQTERLMMSNRPKEPKNARNKNVLVVGGSGSGKTRFFVKPQLMQLHSSYVVTDPKGSVVCEVGKLLERNHYKIKIFNTINFKKSMHYNPFAYIHSEKDILKLVTTLITNTKGDGKSGDEFWTKAETLLYCALIGYIHYEAPPEEQNFTTLLEFINAMEVREDDEEYKNPVDRMFEELEAEKPNHFAVRQYKKYSLAAGKTAKSILVSCGARLAPFDIAELREITMYDELELDTLGDKIFVNPKDKKDKRYYKTALFLIMSDTDSTFNFLISMIYATYMSTLGNRPDLFPDSSYVDSYINTEYEKYEIPAEALSDPQFAAMMEEAEKYLGYPYVWGGSSPSTSFDCSGFVSWVVNHCGVGWNIGRLGADGLRHTCSYVSPSSARPGDLIFFEGTYDTTGASHVGIYLGDNMMIHCGDPIQYADITSNYWQQHFLSFGRLPQP